MQMKMYVDENVDESHVDLCMQMKGVDENIDENVCR